MRSDNTYKNISIVLTWLWGLALLPISVFSFIAGIATIMMTDDGKAEGILLVLIFVDTFLFWAIPVVTLISILLSVSLRKQEKYLLSIRMLLLPIANAIVAFGLLFAMFSPL